MNEFRRDRTSGEWVVIAPERSRRRQQWHCRKNEDDAIPR